MYMKMEGMYNDEILNFSNDFVYDWVLKPGGRICVITFHSLEDRIVKNLFKKYSVVEGNRINDFRKTKLL